VSAPHPTADHHFPMFHLRPPTGYVNDPNGPVFVDGRWHLFYQYTADTARTSPVMWGHASSEDLASWIHHRVALSPDPQGLDRAGCWSGNTIAVDGQLLAFYSGYQRHHQYQSVLLAVSSDNGHSFGPSTQVVADPQPDEGIVSFRDPFVWWEKDRGLMLVGAGATDARASVRLYESTDLRTWHLLGDIAGLHRENTDRWDTGDMWECPQLVSFDNRDVLLVGTYAHGAGIMQVITLRGRRSGHQLEDPQIALYDEGSNFYAASAARHSQYGPIVWGWATEGRTKDWSIHADWSGMITLPRIVAPSPDGRLSSRPIPTLENLRGSLHTVEREDCSASVADLPAQLELHAVLDTRDRPNPTTTLTLQFSPSERLDLVIDWGAGTVCIDRDQASKDQRAHRGSFTFEDSDITAAECLTLRWFIDGSISELFTSSGRCSTVRFYPTSPPPWTLNATGLTSTDQLSIWPMANPYFAE
jgi:beta-fructofuranosidase